MNLEVYLTALDESLRSIRASKLRSALTMGLIAIGIMSLVGILTAIDAIQYSVSSNLSTLGAGSFDIYEKGRLGRRRGYGIQDKLAEPVSYSDVSLFKKAYGDPAKICVYKNLSYSSVARSKGKKTNPNSSIVSSDQNYLKAFGLDLEEGRNFTQGEIKGNSTCIIIGHDIVTELFVNRNPIDAYLVSAGRRWQVIGTIKSAGGVMTGPSGDRLLLVPEAVGRTIKPSANLTASSKSFGLRVLVDKPEELQPSLDKARFVMRQVRQDRRGKPDSFDLQVSESLTKTLGEVGGTLRAGGLIIGLITILGASIGLMNIMIVSVTERTSEIGVRKSLGATSRDIRIQFLTESVIICFAGAVVGVLLGILAGNAVSRLAGNTFFIIPWTWIGLGGLLSIIVGLASGYYPANRAAVVDPIDSLRYE